MVKSTRQFAKHKKGARATVQVKSEHWMEFEKLPPKKAKKRRAIKGRI